MVFCASCRPWPSAIAAAETVWANLKPRVALAGLVRRKIHMIATITRKPRPKATSGERIIGMTTLPSTTDQLAVTPPAMAAPTRPPIRAWEEEEGRPKYHVMRFQAMAPIRPAITMRSPAEPTPGSMTSETVLATF